MIASVFVDPDGTVSFRALEGKRPPHVWRRAKKPRWTVSATMCYEDTPITVDIEEFIHRGHMFDGRPIYCPEGFDIKEVAGTWLMSTYERHVLPQAIQERQREVNQFMRAEYPNAIDLDQWEGDVPLTAAEIADGLERTGMIKRGIRRLIAVPTRTYRLVHGRFGFKVTLPPKAGTRPE